MKKCHKWNIQPHVEIYENPKKYKTVDQAVESITQLNNESKKK